MDTECVIISTERYEELIRAEFLYKCRREELKKSKYANELEKILYGIAEEEEF